MFRRPILVLMLIGFGRPSSVLAQVQILSDRPPVVEYQYQLNYERPWRGWPGPGLSLGGSLPANSREGISSLYGLPFPVPLGAGVYINPFAYSSRLPGPFHFGLTASISSPMASPRGIEQPVTSMAGMTKSMPGNPVIQTAALRIDSAQRKSSYSSPAALQRSQEIEEFGDENLKRQQWTQAYVNYRNAVDTADDRADAHVRLGWTCTALKQFPEAVREFKRALSIDPTTGNSGATLETVFGPESQAVRTEIVHRAARWAREDLRDQDRLFLLGTLLHYNEDPRAREVLEAALNLTGTGDHLVAMLTPSLVPPPLLPPMSPQNSPGPIPEPPEVMDVPVLHRQPLALHESDPKSDRPVAPTPRP